MNDINEKLSKKLKGIKFNEVLAPFTSFNIGGPAKFYYAAKNNKEILNAIKTAKNFDINYFILGNGTNILISDSGFNGLVIKMENQNILFDNEYVIAESGVKIQKLIRETISKNLTGLEYLMGIPGTIGGGVAGNVGTPTDWINKNIVEITIINGQDEIEVVNKFSGNFSYRYSRFKYNNREVIIAVKFMLKMASQTDIQKKVKKYIANRSHQPINEACAGSIFKNPQNKKAWELIDQAGLRGKKMGGAMVSKDHANFIINTGQAKADDVVMLTSYIKQQVRDKFNIQLQEEIKYIGFE
ncbi:UDP-N-acetylmuramate dehydrogenase [Patescibacteria group bacterium]|nr:UDP-N-acetylmuramate dehydrogenase [Patescibacteria group bacterium]MBU0964643.1 UDP-N-acetylmuramate dehydrogenase [Patescibacteria group bacterium]